ncbi:MAG: AIPR family protein [Oscillospiraceae bacterium]|nr:AIPR family protein [Oscillospiraceae bacterium]
MEIYDRIKNDIAQDYYVNHYPNDGQRFVAWYLRNIHNLDTFETKACITDGAGDKQIDAVYIDNQTGTIYIIQGKFYKGGSIDAEPVREVISSWLMIQDLEKLQDSANDALRAKINEIAVALDDDYEVCFELVTTSTLTESAQNDFQLFQQKLSENDTLSANFVLVDNDLLQIRYDEALNKNRPYINHNFTIEAGKYMEMQIGDTKAVIAAIPLKECVKIPGIKDGTLFRKNVRQSLGSGNKVNKGIARTIKNNPEEFFFLHNGITAICSSVKVNDNIMNVRELNVVNGCQSLNTIFSCSESVRKATDAYVMFRFYEISDVERADNISTSTNSQSAVKARDLRSNDKYVLAMKKAYEQRYTDGYFVTKRGEQADSVKYNTAHTVDLSSLGKWLITWHSQRPTMAYSESKIFDKYFDQLFHRDYNPENVQALNEIFFAIQSKWTPDNPLGLNEALLAMKSYVMYHHMYAISVLVCEVNKMQDLVPSPAVTLQKFKDSNLLDTIVGMTGQILNVAFDLAVDEANQNSSRVFSPQNWCKAKGSLKDIRSAVKQYFLSAKMIPGAKEVLDDINQRLQMSKDDFESRWTAD